MFLPLSYNCDTYLSEPSYCVSHATGLHIITSVGICHFVLYLVGHLFLIGHLIYNHQSPYLLCSSAFLAAAAGFYLWVYISVLVNHDPSPLMCASRVAGVAAVVMALYSASIAALAGYVRASSAAIGVVGTLLAAGIVATPLVTRDAFGIASFASLLALLSALCTLLALRLASRRLSTQLRSETLADATMSTPLLMARINRTRRERHVRERLLALFTLLGAREAAVCILALIVFFVARALTQAGRVQQFPVDPFYVTAFSLVLFTLPVLFIGLTLYAVAAAAAPWRRSLSNANHGADDDDANFNSRTLSPRALRKARMSDKANTYAAAFVFYDTLICVAASGAHDTCASVLAHNIGWTVVVAKASARCLWFSAPLLLATISPSLVTHLRRFAIGVYLPIEHALQLHALASHWTLILSVLHAVAHIVLVATHPPAPVAGLPPSRVQRLIWFPWSTGWLAFAGLVVVAGTGMARSATEHVIGYTGWQRLHQLGTVLFIAMIMIHGALRLLGSFPYGGAIFYTSAVALLIVDALLRRWNRVRSTSLAIEPINKTFYWLIATVRGKQAARAAEYKPAQYVYLRAPRLSLLNWHPFTIALIDSVADDDVQVRFLIENRQHERAWTQQLFRAIVDEQRALRLDFDGPFSSAISRALRPAVSCAVLVVGGSGVTTVFDRRLRAARSGDAPSDAPPLLFVFFQSRDASLLRSVSQVIDSMDLCAETREQLHLRCTATEARFDYLASNGVFSPITRESSLDESIDCFVCAGRGLVRDVERAALMQNAIAAQRGWIVRWRTFAENFAHTT